MKVYNLGIKIQQTGVGQPAIKMVSLMNWTPDREIMESHRANFEHQLINILGDGRALRGYAPMDPTVHVCIGPRILSQSVIETTIIELEQE